MPSYEIFSLGIVFASRFFGLLVPGHPGRGKSKVRKKSLVIFTPYVSVPRLATAR